MEDKIEAKPEEKAVKIKSVEVKSVKLIVGEQEIELSLEDARKLRDELDYFFGDSNRYPAYPFPSFPRDYFYPYFNDTIISWTS